MPQKENKKSTTAITATKGFEQYTKNAFRILGLNGNATYKDVVEAASTLRRANKIETSKESLWDLPWLGVVGRSNTEIQNAESRVTDPELRLHERLFWFHSPTLDKESVPELCDEWLQSNSAWSCHDVAVLKTLSACVVDPSLKKEGVWLDVVNSWSAVANEDKYWLLLMDADDEGQFEPAISVSEISELQNNCLQKALSPILEIAKQSIAVGDTETTNRALRALTADCVPKDTRVWFEQEIAFQLEEELAVVLKTFKESCIDKIKRDDGNSKADIEANRACCNQLKKQYQRELKPKLDAIISIFGFESTTAKHSRESVAECLQLLASAFTWADGRKESTELLEIAAGLAEDSIAEARISEHLDSMKEQLQLSEAIEENEASYKENIAYDVALPGTAYSMPQVCPCCLNDPNTTITVFYEWEENYVVYRRTKSVSFKFPYCNDCLKHASEMSSKRLLLIFLTSASTIGFEMLFQAFQNIAVVLFNVFFCIFFAFLWSKTVRLRELKSHCTRGDAVQIFSANDNFVFFRFWNKRYAEAFAKSNKRGVSTQSRTKHGLFTSLWDGKTRNQIVLWSVLLSFIPVVFINFGSWVNSTSSSDGSVDTVNSEPHNTAEVEVDSPSSSRGNTSDEESRSSRIKKLKARLESGREQIKQFELVLDELKKKIQPLKSELSEFKNSLTAFEDQLSQGIEVDRKEYERALNAHNNLVKRLNRHVNDYQAAYAKYSKLVDEDKEIVRQHNSLVRR